MSFVELRQLEKRFGNHVALRGVDLQVEEGEFVSLLGASGSGKTTTLRIIAGFEAPDAGDVRIGGQSVLGRGPAKRGIGIVFQQYALFPHMNVLENVAFGLEAKGQKTRTAQQRAREMLQLVELNGVEQRRAHELSGGQQQRVALARALAVSPRVLLLDEPLGALDKKLREQMQIALMELHQELGITMIYVTHDQEEALSMSDRVAVMRDGAILQFAPPQTLYSDPANQYVYSFVGRITVFEAVAVQISGNRILTDRGITGVKRGEIIKGARCRVCIRPERIRVHSGQPETSDENCVTASVRGRVFLGQTTSYIVQLNGSHDQPAERVESSVLTEADEARARVGSDVTLSFAATDALVFPADEAIESQRV